MLLKKYSALHIHLCFTFLKNLEHIKSTVNFIKIQKHIFIKRKNNREYNKFIPMI